MFTGLVETQGKVVQFLPNEDGNKLVIQSNMFDETIKMGESIAVNGVCLTVVTKDQQQSTFQLAPETLRRTNLVDLKPGCMVNLERALKMGDRLGGHWVQGHVDGVGILLRRQPDQNWELFHFELPGELSRYAVAKGSITVNGVSLTVVNVSDSQFSIALIPHTLVVTNLGQLKPGDKVNLEVDILAKYVERLLSARHVT